ncbi:hypothetical protein M9Y10_023257 [Tritrichomonas musculus]|uniref:Uncharacterized protein n=1 Tax=Tritrichomonas musculus TaxID=1915356 RepID=A0ABR2KUM7_9EUKA
MQKQPYIQKDNIFVQRQKEIQSLHHQLHEVIQGMNKVSPVIDEAIGLNDDDYDDDNELADAQILSQSEISPEQEIRLLIREIQQLQTDVLYVQRQLVDRYKNKRNTRISMLTQQLVEISHVLDNQLFRAKRLLK